MISLAMTEVFNIEGAIRGMRNPMNSWKKSDSDWACIYEGAECSECRCYDICSDNQYILGDNDMDLCKRLIRAGTEHRKFLRQISVCVDIIAPLYWWKEFDTYKIGTTANSTSTMHKIHTKPFAMQDFSFDESNISDNSYFEEVILPYLESLRVKYNDTKEKKVWRTLIQTLPSGYNQTRTVTLNYEVLLNIYFQRDKHKLSEWHRVNEWILNLPYMKEWIECLQETK